MLIVQVLLLAATAFIAPLSLRPRWVTYVLYTFAAVVLWLAYTVAAMVLDSKAGKDVPGGGYLFVGLLSWIVGSAVFLFRINKRK